MSVLRSTRLHSASSWWPTTWWSSCHAGEATWLTSFSAQRPFVLNIAEGAGEFAPKEKARFYRMARRSATESAAVLDVCRNLKLLADERHAAGRDLLLQVVSMLVRMITNLGREEGKGRGKGRED